MRERLAVRLFIERAVEWLVSAPEVRNGTGGTVKENIRGVSLQKLSRKDFLGMSQSRGLLVYGDYCLDYGS